MRIAPVLAMDGAMKDQSHPPVAGALDTVGHVVWRADDLGALRAGVFVVRLHIVDDHAHLGAVSAPSVAGETTGTRALPGVIMPMQADRKGEGLLDLDLAVLGRAGQFEGLHRHAARGRRDGGQPEARRRPPLGEQPLARAEHHREND